MIEVIGMRSVTWSRITDDEGWEHGFMRAVNLHEHLGQRVRLIRQSDIGSVPVCEFATEDGWLRVRPSGAER